jgi:hypothetical protein
MTDHIKVFILFDNTIKELEHRNNVLMMENEGHIQEL